MVNYKLLLFISLIFLIISPLVLAADGDSVVLQNDQTGVMMNDLLVMLSFAAVVFTIAIIIKIIMMLKGSGE
jgi:hypothetical protein